MRRSALILIGTNHRHPTVELTNYRLDMIRHLIETERAYSCAMISVHLVLLLTDFRCYPF